MFDTWVNGLLWAIILIYLNYQFHYIMSSNQHVLQQIWYIERKQRMEHVTNKIINFDIIFSSLNLNGFCCGVT